MDQSTRKTLDAICDHLKLPRGATCFSFYSSFHLGVPVKGCFWITLAVCWPDRPQRLISLDPTELDALETALKG